MGRAPCCDKANVKKGPWSPEEDGKLKDYIQTHGTGGNWIALPQKAGLRRCGKSCRLRWLNYLRPNIKHGEFSDEEDKLICALFASIGSRWSIMAAQLPGRTDNDIKNYWNTKLKKKMMNSLIIMPEFSKPLHHNHHHLQSFNSSTNYSYSSSPSPSYMYTTHTSTYHDHDQTLAISSSPTTTTTAAAAVSDHHHHHHHVLQSQDHGYQASSSSNSDGSCHYEYGNIGLYDHNNMGHMRSDDSYKEFGVNIGDSSLDSSLEEIKQLISTNLCSGKIDNNLNFFIDETKEGEKIMYF